jgi:hypothetical protein
LSLEVVDLVVAMICPQVRLHVTYHRSAAFGSTVIASQAGVSCGAGMTIEMPGEGQILLRCQFSLHLRGRKSLDRLSIAYHA